MNKFILSFFLLMGLTANAVETGPVDCVLHMPHSGSTRPLCSSMDLSKSAAVGTSLLNPTNGGSGTNTSGFTGVPLLTAGIPSPLPLTPAAVASTIPFRDANTNSSFNQAVNSYASTVTAAGTTTLTASSAPIQNFTGTTTQTVKLPDETTLPQSGFQFTIINNSTGILTIQNNASSTQVALQPGNSAIEISTSIASSSAGWNLQLIVPVKSNWSATSSGFTANQTSTSQADFTSPSGTLSSNASVNMSCSAASGQLGITCTLPSTGIYNVCFYGDASNTSALNSATTWLTDGSNTVFGGPQHSVNPSVNALEPIAICGNYNAISTSVTFKLRGAVSAATGSWNIFSITVNSMAAQ